MFFSQTPIAYVEICGSHGGSVDVKQTLVLQARFSSQVRVWPARLEFVFDINTATVTSTYFYICDWSLRKRNPLTFSTLMLHHSKFDSGKQNLLRFMQCITPKRLVGGMAHVQFLSISSPFLTAAWLYMSCYVGNS